MLPGSRGDAIVDAYDELARRACGGIDPRVLRAGRESGEVDEERWDQVYASSTHAVVRVCRELTRRARAREGAFARLTLAPDFVAVICDPSLGREGEELLAACVDEPLRSRLFGTDGSRR